MSKPIEIDLTNQGDRSEGGALPSARAASLRPQPPAASSRSGIPNAEWRLPTNAGVCAFDRDECTVTIAVDTEADVEALITTLPSRNRVRLIALRAAIERKDAERGRPLTDRERLENLAAWLAENEDEDGLDPVEALVCDAAAAERSCAVHEGAAYYAERIIRRAIAQGALSLASAMSAGTAETAQQAQGEARQRGAGTADAQ